MGPVLIALLIILTSCIAYIFLWASKQNKYFHVREIPHEKPVLIFGNNWRHFRQKVSFGENLKELCEKFPTEPVIGAMNFVIPMYLVKDVEYAERVLIKDFVHFVDRGLPTDDDPLNENLFLLKGNKWRAMRNKLSPIFTTGKLKNMIGEISKISDHLCSIIDEGEKECANSVMLFSRFTIDVIGSCAFGIETGSLANPDSEFSRMTRRIFQVSITMFLKFITIMSFPWLIKTLKIKFADAPIRDYFCNVIRETVEYRKKNNLTRNDFVDLMLQLRNKGYVEITTKDPDDDYLGIDSISHTTSTYEITDDALIGSAFIFLTAGMEATSNTLAFIFYELSKNNEIQDKARAEVMKCVKENNGKLDYDSIKGMAYLEMCIKETSRKWPSVQTLVRVCTKEYTFPNGIKIQPGDSVMIPVLYIHKDPQYYPDPEEFDPERFAPDVSRPCCSYLPFGEGPRICIGMRFAILELKLCVAKMLLNFNIKLNPNTKEPLILNKRQFITQPKDPIYLDFIKI